LLKGPNCAYGIGKVLGVVKLVPGFEVLTPHEIGIALVRTPIEVVTKTTQPVVF
jgi:hypothetical protein